MILMTKRENKNEGPACACGKGDLYEEWLKNENKPKEAPETGSSKQTKTTNKS